MNSVIDRAHTSHISRQAMEDGIFKSDYTVLEDGCTVGTGALVHYDVTMGQGSQLLPDSFIRSSCGMRPGGGVLPWLSQAKRML